MQIIVRDNSGLKANDIKMRSIGQQLVAVGVLTLPDFGEQTLRMWSARGSRRKESGGREGTGWGPAGGASLGDPAGPNPVPRGT